MVLNHSCKLIVICDSHGFWAIHWNDNRILCITLRIEAITDCCSLIPFLYRFSMIPRGVYLRILWCYPWFVCLSLSWLAGQQTFCILLIEDFDMLHIASKIGNSFFIWILKDFDLIQFEIFAYNLPWHFFFRSLFFGLLCLSSKREWICNVHLVNW